MVNATACHDYRGMMWWLTLPPVMLIGSDVVNAITCHDYRGLMWWLTLLTVMTVIEIGSQILYFSHFTHL